MHASDDTFTDISLQTRLRPVGVLSDLTKAQGIYRLLGVLPDPILDYSLTKKGQN